MEIVEKIQEDAHTLGVDLPSGELAALMQENNASAESIRIVSKVFGHLREKKWDATVSMYLKTSRLPRKNPRTFDNFDFNCLKGNDVVELKNLQTLSMLHAHRNLAFIGPPGIGKTHLAQAFGTECCHRGFKVYFLTFTELNQKLTEARRSDRIGSAVNGMVKPACLIIDEVGQCVLDRENTRIFFDVVNRRYNKEGPGSMVFTSNVQPDQWSFFFSDDHSLLCSLDRLFDTAMVCTMKGKSYRGKGRVTLAVEASGTTTK